jgi:hypothetical protein
MPVASPIQTVDLPPQFQLTVSGNFVPTDDVVLHVFVKEFLGETDESVDSGTGDEKAV